MKVTGIVRRMDDLGRVVIPKEIRRSLKLQEGDPLEITTQNDGEVLFRKYSPVGELPRITAEYVEVLSRVGQAIAVICDKERVVAVCGLPKKEVLHRPIAPFLADALKERRTLLRQSPQEEGLLPIEEVAARLLVSVPVVAQSDVCGAVLFLSEREQEVVTPVLLKLCEAAAGFLAKQLEM